MRIRKKSIVLGAIFFVTTYILLYFLIDKNFLKGQNKVWIMLHWSDVSGLSIIFTFPVRLSKEGTHTVEKQNDIRIR